MLQQLTSNAPIIRTTTKTRYMLAIKDALRTLRQSFPFPIFWLLHSQSNPQKDQTLVPLLCINNHTHERLTIHFCEAQYCAVGFFVAACF